MTGQSPLQERCSRLESIVHDWRCGCGWGQACPDRDGCREAAEQIAAEFVPLNVAENLATALAQIEGSERSGIGCHHQQIARDALAGNRHYVKARGQEGSRDA